MNSKFTEIGRSNVTYHHYNFAPRLVILSETKRMAWIEKADTLIWKVFYLLLFLLLHFHLDLSFYIEIYFDVIWIFF